jgi:beta-phosphoglucomutase-like phosphatase (HAD superfamily)
MTEARFWGFAGVPLPDIVAGVYGDKHDGAAPSPEFVAEFLAEKIAFHKSQEAVTGAPPAIECVVNLVHEYKKRGIKVAVASSGLRDAVERHCEHAGILDLFDAVVVAAEVPKGKPAPDVFLKAAELIGADPAKCRAYEVGIDTHKVTQHTAPNVFLYMILFRVSGWGVWHRVRLARWDACC